MAQDISLLGAEYSDVPAIILPKTSGGSAQFVDISSDTLTEDVLLTGYTAHMADGTAITGTLAPKYEEPYVYDYIPGYTNAGKWIYENSTNNRSDFYHITPNHHYLLTLGASVGTRFRAASLMTDPNGWGAGSGSGTINGTQIVEIKNPTSYAYAVFTAGTFDLFLTVTKDNAGTSGLKSYLIDITN